ncbi:MAG: histidine kinase [Actinomycetota bacterium]
MAIGRPQPVRWLREHPAVADLLLASLLTVLVLVAHVGQSIELDAEELTVADPTWWSPILAVAAVFPLAWRRSSPLVVATIVTAAQVVFTALDFVGTGFLGVLIATYSMGAHATGRRRSQVLVVVIAMIGWLFVAGLIVDELDVTGFVASVVALATSFFLGDNLRRRRDAAEAMTERAERAERERSLLAERQVSAERARIARELHDVVAHSVSVMVIHAGAARRNLRTSPDDVEVALAGIETTGRQTMTELRAILGVLRGAADHADHRDRGDRFGGNVGTSIGGGGGRGGERAPQPSLADLDQLTATADLPLHVSVVGDVSALPQSATLTGYRVVQEALTNIRRHGGDVRRVDVEIVVDLDVRPGSLRISVLDDGRGAAADDVGSGFGVMGMHERVTAIGGTISTGPRPGGGWRVAADIPVDVAYDTAVDAAGDVASVDRTPASELARQRVDR